LSFTVVSTFSGCGGSSLGYQSAGGRVLLAVEWDTNAVETYSLNFPDSDIYHGDIHTLTAPEVLRRTGLKRGELDILDGSPPCQGFSMVGRREFTDARNQLFREYCRLLKELQPKVFVMENVSGMAKGKMRLIFAEVLKELESCGYTVKARLLNAMYYGVPQSRQRIIFIGVRDELHIEPSHPAGSPNLVTASQALEGLTIDEQERAWLLEAGIRYAAFREWHLIPPGKNRRDIGFKSGYSCSKAHPDKPAPTITKNDSYISAHGILHWSERRRFTVGEFKRLASFPDSFQFVGGYQDGVARIGNSVPPESMRRVAGHVQEGILNRRNTEAIGGE
jgi:DNA (cytosine-5)-methyltransferase 1